MKNLPMILLALFLAAGIPAATGEEAFSTDFNRASDMAQWSRSPGIMTYSADEGRNGSGCVVFRSDDSNGGLSALKLDAAKLRGRGIQVEGWIKAENVAKPTKYWLGPKMMLSVTYGGGRKSNSDQAKKIGTYDWEKFTAFTRVPYDASDVSLCLGLQGASGKVWIDDVKVTVLPPPVRTAVTVNPLPVQKETKFRGVMSGNDLSEAAMRELGQVWHANLLRFQIGSPGKSYDHSTEEGFRRIVERKLKELDEVIPRARKYGIRILIDMHVGPGTKVNNVLSNQLSWEPKMQQLLADVWREIAAKYKNEPVIWGYDLLNEPREENYVYTPEGGLDWNRLAGKIAASIRGVDPDTPIIVESPQWGSAAGFAVLEPIGLPNIIYSFHCYSPGEYTHQGIHGRPEGIRYPGKMEGKEWNRKTLEEEMRPVIEFQKRYNVPIYVGEFGVVRWAPNAEQYLEDMISIFEEHGWDWTFHAFREYDGWSAECGPDRKDTRFVGDTAMRRVLLKFMKKNGR